MCGRFALYSSPEELAQYFSATLSYQFAARYNIAPTAIIPVLVQIDGERAIVPMRWGLIPSWHSVGQTLGLLNNAKIETVDTKPSFRAPFKRHRCLIIANGFYEWDSSTKPKQPYYFHMKDDAPIAMAGIWDRWVSEDKSVESCCIITEPANKIVSNVHDRMPALIIPDDIDAWLKSSSQDINILKELASKNESYKHIQKYPVTSKMSKASFEGSNCIERIR